ncbi:MAG: DUF5683 domain-containing protein [Balneolaceae bacterium]
MRALTFFIFIWGCLGNTAHSQSVLNFTGDIFKNEAKESEIPPLHISDFTLQNNLSSNSFLDLPRTKPGIAFLSSAIIPGTGQAANGKWVRAGIYFTAEVVGIIYHLDRNAKARRQERSYENFTHQNWSVLAYSQWLVQYSRQYNLDNNWELLEAQIAGQNPDFTNTTNDWSKVDINLLHSIENRTHFIFNDPQGCQPDNCRRASEFSHELPKYGSQQFYELISKYYQYQPGWRDWHAAITMNNNQNQDLYRYMWNGQDQPFNLFYQGRDRAEEFNDNYRVAGNILKLLLVNHVVSAFDALFTVQLKNSRIQTDTNLLRLEQFSVSWHF